MSKQPKCQADIETAALERKSPMLANIRGILGCHRLVSALIVMGGIYAASFLLVWSQLCELANETQALRLEFSVRMKAVEVKIATGQDDQSTNGLTNKAQPINQPADHGGNPPPTPVIAKPN